MMFTADQFVAHLVGDYVLQSDWQANEKTKKSVAALAHALTYTLPFLFITQSPVALAVICSTHFVIDRWRLARFVVYAKNFLSPRVTSNTTLVEKQGVYEKYMDTQVTSDKWWHPWAECVGTGYHKDRPPWLAVWLLIIADNTLHIVINGLAIKFLN